MSWIYRHRKMLVIAAILFGILLLVSAVIFHLMRQAEQQQEHQEVIAHYERQIEQLTATKEESLQTVWTVARTIPDGEQIEPEDVTAMTLPTALVSPEMIAKEEEAVGKHAKVELRPGMPLLASVLYEGNPIAKDVRTQEFQIIQLPSHLGKAQYIDVRINFPTGEDFVVLAKKQVLDREGTVIWLEMNETDLLLTSSAIIDAYLQGARLYAVPYIEPGLQEAATATYPANPMVLDLLEQNPNLVEQVSTELARQQRERLESNLNEMSEADKMRVMYGNVTVQQQLMNERAATQQSNAAQQMPQPLSFPEQDDQESVQGEDEQPPSSLPVVVEEESPEATLPDPPPASEPESETAPDYSEIFNQ
ncbi:MULTISPECIES: SAF domain-containing protein [Paenibacillus]|uniref:SAF domain protein n=2 Tax=Paenibacillus lactis TaxID=228574 RepID=G4HIM2_9BACL|nr:SAF domain-containing protein [Paenibacillus lactis]EHB63195.1 SAF domain protein [Paenibacillus lactis 154]MBP1895825.1 DNA-binding protein H-NS [Paenibacillus lactis]GIO91560.1 hypothetical protein J31TS3_27870 [Paenibacillus lactis]HAG01499.1 hypothetical protein [Paenibacillus lactis]